MRQRYKKGRLNLRLLFYVEHFKMAGSGMENQAVRLCKALADRGHEVHVLSDDAVAVSGVTVHHGIENSVSTCDAIVPHLTIDWGYILPADVHRLGGGTHSQFIEYNLSAYTGLKKVLKRLSYLKVKHQRKIAKERALLRNPDARILANSAQTAKMAIADGADEARITVRHQSVDTVQFSPSRNKTFRGDARDALGIAEHETAFIFVAHNLKLKNLRLLRQVFEVLSKRLSLKLIVAGKRRPKFTAPWLVYAGTTDRMETFYAAADVMLHPTFFDSCANVVIEAMACGLPVVVSDTAGINEILSHGSDAIVLPVRGDASKVRSQWSDAIVSLVEDEALRERMGTAARATAEKHDYDSFLDWFDKYLVEVRQAKEERER